VIPLSLKPDRISHQPDADQHGGSDTSMRDGLLPIVPLDKKDQDAC